MPQKKLPFYLIFYCHQCNTTFCVEIYKHEHDIPHEHRTRVINAIHHGSKFLWTLITEEEATRLEDEINCPKEYDHYIEVVWPIDS